MKDRAAGLGLDLVVQDGARLPEAEEEVGGGSHEPLSKIALWVPCWCTNFILKQHNFDNIFIKNQHTYMIYQSKNVNWTNY